MRRKSFFVSIASLFTAAAMMAGCGASAPPLVGPSHGAVTHARVPTQIISATAEGTAKELFERGESALLAQRWKEAADAFETLLAAERDGAPPDLHAGLRGHAGMDTPALLYDLAIAYE